MITLINKLISLLPNQRDEVYQTHWMFHHGIDPVPLWTVNWLYELLTFFMAEAGSSRPRTTFRRRWALHPSVPKTFQ
jgi:hypothetical protein